MLHLATRALAAAAPSNLSTADPITIGIAVLFFLFIFLFLIAVTILVIVPFMGAIIRLRTNYNPRSLSLSEEEQYSKPRLTGLIQTLKRTKRLEGWYGIYKGAYALALSTLVILIFSTIFGIIAGSTIGNPQSAIFLLVLPPFACVVVLIMLPVNVVIIRSIITPYRLPNSVRGSLHILLTQYERSNALALYKTPGLVAVTALTVFLSTVVMGFVNYALIGPPPSMIPPAPGQPPAPKVHLAPWRMALYVIVNLLTILWTIPLDTVTYKLSAQPNLGPDAEAYTAVPAEEFADDIPPAEVAAGRPGDVENLRYAGEGEDVIALRPTTDPYTGLVDCVRKIRAEEGTGAFYRLWWWTLFWAVLGAVSIFAH